MAPPALEKDVPNVPAALTPGTKVGAYVIEDVLSSGGFGVVHRARDGEQRQVAIKVSKHSARSITAQELVWQQNEIEALTRLRHPALVEVLGYGFLEDGRLYLVMELVRGEVLGQYLQRRGPLEALEALQLTRRIAEALAWCHEAKVLHLDLKPANIIITDAVEPRVKVLDFGLARLSSGFRTHEGGPVAGTLSYLAPECFFGAVDRFSEQVDLYALGTLLYEMLSLRLPFPNDKPYAEVGTLKRSGAMTPLEEACPRVPSAVAALVRSLLEPEPEQRFGGAARLAIRLQAVYFDLLRGRVGHRESTPSPVPAQLAQEVPFVGRQRELTLLQEAVDALVDCQGRALMLVGEAGMGKSRLISEVLLHPEGGMRLLVGYGRCRQLGELVPYSPLREALGQLVDRMMGLRGEPGQRVRGVAGVSLTDEAQELLRLVPELARLLPSKSGRGTEGALVQGLGPERVGKALGHLFSAVGAVYPLVLVLEDVHWSDEGTLAVLSRLTAEPPPGVLLLCTTRPPPRLARSGALRMLTLHPLSAEENELLLATLVGGAASSVVRTLMQWVPFLAMGNPLAGVRIIQDLQHGGYLSRDAEGRIRLSERLRGEYRPPEAVSTVMGCALEVPARRVLRVAALIGRRFLGSDLAALGLFTQEEVRTALVAAEAQRLCSSSGDTCTFSSESVRERLAAYEVELEEDDAAIHRRIAERLRQRNAPSATLGPHWEKAGETMRAASVYVEAGLEAERLLEPIAASQHLRKAYLLLCTLPGSVERDALLVRALCERIRVGGMLGQGAEMLQCLESCAALPHLTPVQALSLKSASARVYYAQGDFIRALDFSRQCLALPVEGAPRGLLCVPKNIVGRALCSTGRFGPAVPVLSEAVALAAEAGEAVEQAHSEGLLALSLAYCGEYRQARECVASASRMALRLGNPVRMVASLFYSAAVAEAGFRWDEGVKRTAEMLAYTEANGITGVYLCVALIYAGRQQFHVGQLGRARHLLQQALEVMRRQDTRYGQPVAYAFLGDVEFVAGRLEEARLAYARGLELSTDGAQNEHAEALCLVGQAHLEALAGGEVERVRTLGSEAVARLKAAGNLSSLVLALQRSAEALEELGDSAGAAPLFEEWRQLAARLGLTEYDFWPRVVPGPPGEPLAPRRFWRLNSEKSLGASPSSSPMEPGDSDDETVVRAIVPSETEKP
ncbi:serine/threonine-protein kinase PknK [Stigmatella aurantiaca]|uniref:Serine/threonine-protein kinase n=1 Tax=Stigmatella aurantiaca (strain DW4/3-1) TaxID=378806 RepID=Q092A7_STIAD|nr:protein kinase [Stigmatella aurantiaca]ADO75722.1 serine/threonine-protein kinase [Stigmatella aurantiaca DW4/3-1]EAU66566.1 probable serine/threonine-protein kinase PknA [Stigmatella aurantiaca DW4/3-1]